jgi:hypothetical protein
MSKTIELDDIKPEYDFSGGIRGKHHRAYQQGTNLVLLEADVAEVFKDSEAVNRALRLLMNLASGEVKRNTAKDQACP